MENISILQSKPKQMRKKYVDNDLFLKKIKEYKKEYKKDPTTPIPSELGEILYSIATNLAKAPQFNGYTFKEEMISDALLNCVEKFHNFSPRKSKNPFSYFTQIIYFAFLRRIKGEQKHSYIKNKKMQELFEELKMNEPLTKKTKMLHYEMEHENWEKWDKKASPKVSKKNGSKKRKPRKRSQ